LILVCGKFTNENISAEKTVVTIDAKLAYRDKEDKDGDWKYYASSREHRMLECTMKEVRFLHDFKLDTT